jgi:WD40 repeat protein/tetratricopeptide (TPR) repeat protein
MDTYQRTVIRKGLPRIINTIRFSPDNQYLIYGESDNNVMVWDINNNQTSASLTVSGMMASAAFSRNGRYLAVGTDNDIRIWDFMNRSEILTLRDTAVTTWRGEGTAHNGTVISVEFTQDDTKLISGSIDNTVKIWDVSTGHLLNSLRHGSDVECTHITVDCKHLYAGCEDGSLYIWNLDLVGNIATFRGHLREITGIALTNDAQTIITSSADGTVKYWDACVHKSYLNEYNINATSFWSLISPDSRYIALENIVWDAVLCETAASLDGYGEMITCGEFSSDGKLLVTGSQDGNVRLWDARTGEWQKTYRGHSDEITTVAFSPNGKYIISGSDDRTARLWNVNEDTQPCEPLVHKSFVRNAVFSPNNEYIATGGLSSQILIWNAITGEKITELMDLCFPIGLVFTPDGNRLTAAFEDGYIRSWDTHSWLLMTELQYVQKKYLSTSYSQDSARLSLGSYDATALTWDISQGIFMKEYAGHVEPVQSVALNPNGVRLLTGSSDQTVKLWDVNTGIELMTYRGYETGIRKVMYSPNGKYMLSSDGYSNNIYRDSTPYGTRMQKRVAAQAVRRGAEQYLSTLLDDVKTDSMIIAHIKEDRSIDDAVRTAALQIMYSRHIKAISLAQRAWSMVIDGRDSEARPLLDQAQRIFDYSLRMALLRDKEAEYPSLMCSYIVRQPGYDMEYYEIAYQLAQNAYAINPDSDRYITTLGATCYRLSRYCEALERLDEADHLKSNDEDPEKCGNTAFLAMTLQQLGRETDAYTQLDRLRKSVSSSKYLRDSKEANLLLREVEQTLGVADSLKASAESAPAGAP